MAVPLVGLDQRWAPALFSRFRAREREARRKKSAKKSESAEREKKGRIRAFSSTHSGNPVSEPKAARQGEKQGP